MHVKTLFLYHFATNILLRSITDKHREGGVTHRIEALHI